MSAEEWLEPGPETRERVKRFLIWNAVIGILSPEETNEINGTISLEWGHRDVIWAHLEIGKTTFSFYMSFEGGILPTIYADGEIPSLDETLEAALRNHLTR